MSIKVVIPEEAIDLTNHSLQFDLLNLRHTKIEEIYINDQVLNDRLYSVEGNRIKFTSQQLKSKNDKVVVYASVATRRLKIENYITIIVAIIGFIGTISQAFISKGFFVASPRSDSCLVMFEPDLYGVDKTQKKFMTSMRWEEPNESNCAFPESISRTHMAWAFVRIRNNLVDIRETPVGEVTGPMHLKNGMRFGVDIPNLIYDEYINNKKYIQLIVLAVPKGRIISPGLKIGELGSDVKVLLTPAEGSKL